MFVVYVSCKMWKNWQFARLMWPNNVTMSRYIVKRINSRTFLPNGTKVILQIVHSLKHFKMYCYFFPNHVAKYDISIGRGPRLTMRHMWCTIGSSDIQRFRKFQFLWIGGGDMVKNKTCLYAILSEWLKNALHTKQLPQETSRLCFFFFFFFLQVTFQHSGLLWLCTFCNQSDSEARGTRQVTTDWFKMKIYFKN